MPSLNLRLKLFKKLAKLDKEIETDKVVQKTPNLGTPPSFSASSKYPSLRKAFDNASIETIDNLSKFINSSLFYASNGKYNILKLANDNFNYTASDIPSTAKDLRLLLLFAKDIYNTLYNRGIEYENKLNKNQYLNKINSLLESINLNNLSQINPSSQLAVKLGTNIKTEIIDTLNYMKNIAPLE